MKTKSKNRSVGTKASRHADWDAYYASERDERGRDATATAA